MAVKTSKKNTTAAETAKKAMENLSEDFNAVPMLGIDPTAERPEPINAEEVPRDFTEEGKTPDKLPGEVQPIEDWRANDYTYFPGSAPEVAHHRAYDRKIGRMRPIGRPHDYAYQWEAANPRGIASAKATGWRFCLYDGGSLSGLDEGGFQGTDLFERTPDGRVMNGDVYLMFMDRRKWIALKERRVREQDTLNQKPMNDFFNDSYKHGIRGFIEDDWGEAHYQQDDRPPGHTYN